MSDEHQGAMLRKVAWDRILQMADELENPLLYSAEYHLAQLISQGDTASSRAGLVRWGEGQVWDLQHRKAPPAHYRNVLATYEKLRGVVMGQSQIHRTEFSLLSELVGPDFRKKVLTWHEFRVPGQLRMMLAPGHEILETGHTGAGKTHLAMLIAEEVLKLGEHVHVVTNIPRVQQRDGFPHPRIHKALRLSAVLRTWCDLPVGALLVFVLDEPESVLRAGAVTKAKENFGNFRYITRKLGISQIQIWHSEDEILKVFRVDADPRVTRIHKTEHDAMTVHRATKAGSMQLEYTGIPDLADLQFWSEGLHTLAVDVDMAELEFRLESAQSMEDIKTLIRSALDDPDVYFGKFKRRKKDEQNGSGSEARDQRILRELDELRTIVLTDALNFVGSHGKFAREIILTIPNRKVTQATAARMSSEMNKQLDEDLEAMRRLGAVTNKPADALKRARRLQELGRNHPSYAQLVERRLFGSRQESVRANAG